MNSKVKKEEKDEDGKSKRESEIYVKFLIQFTDSLCPAWLHLHLIRARVSIKTAAMILIGFPVDVVPPFRLISGLLRLDNGMYRRLDSWLSIVSAFRISPDLATGASVEVSDNLENGANRSGPFPGADSQG